MIISKASVLESFENEIREFETALQHSGLYGALEYLNNRTPHRYTGVYLYNGLTLKNVMLYDKYDPEMRNGEDTPKEATYCSLLQRHDTLEIMNAANDIRVKGIINTPVTSYSGVPIRDASGKAIGSLCHFDMKSCQERQTDFPLLEAAAKIIFDFMQLSK